MTNIFDTGEGGDHQLLIDLGKGHNALGATALAQVYRQLGDKPADVRDAASTPQWPVKAISARVTSRPPSERSW
jgi:phosphoribosylformylglycinamidine synthase